MTRDSMSISGCISEWRSVCGPTAVAARSRRPREQRAQAHQVVRRRGEGNDPIDAFPAPMPEFAQPADGFQPAEDLLDQLPLLLADRVAGMTGGPSVDGTAP